MVAIIRFQCDKFGLCSESCRIHTHAPRTRGMWTLNIKENDMRQNAWIEWLQWLNVSYALCVPVQCLWPSASNQLKRKINLITVHSVKWSDETVSRTRNCADKKEWWAVFFSCLSLVHTVHFVNRPNVILPVENFPSISFILYWRSVIAFAIQFS